MGHPIRSKRQHDGLRKVAGGKTLPETWLLPEISGWTERKDTKDTETRLAGTRRITVDKNRTGNEVLPEHDE